MRVSLAAVVVLVAAVVALSEAQGQEAEMQKCRSQKTCRQCIQTPDCMWCSEPKDNAKKTNVRVEHCQHTSFDATFCDPKDLENPFNQLTFVKEESLTVAGHKKNPGQPGGPKEKIIQLSPQHVKLRLRKGVPATVNLHYRQQGDYPIDLYYLMDLSNSMADDKEKLAELGNDLASLMKSLTTQFTLGFGSFVDKVVMPFVNTVPEKLQTPCRNCAAPYSFRNDLKLDTNSTLFTQKVRAAEISGNMDAPEGGFDALMQVMTCTEEIGWREQARRIVIFSTDAKFHSAGDGRLAGIVEPNDGQCHLNGQKEYTAYSQYDYPSIGQINKVAKDRDINLIFAVSNHEQLYSDLTDLLETASYGMLAKDSSNVVNLVEEQYNKISSKVRLRDNSTGSSVTIAYKTNCKGNGPLIASQECDNIKENDNVTFILEVTAMECPPRGENTIIEVKTLEDSLILEIESLCYCDCDSESQSEEVSPECNNQGALVCGVCSCNEGFRGDQCQCDTKDSASSDEDLALCMPNDGTNKTCSGLGYCTCGVCVCFDSDMVTGAYCQCNKRKCVAPEGKECSDHGTCDCDRCNCDPGYTGEFCECRDNTACRAPGGQLECSGHGDCRCGKCRCRQEQDVSYTGQFCEECPTCKTGRCKEFRDCVECTQFGTGPLEGNRCASCTIEPFPVDNLNGQIALGARLCTFQDAEGCLFNFTYNYIDQETKYEIYVQREKQCPEPANILGIVFGLIGAIVAIGLLTLVIWKLVTTVHDRREYAKFESERRRARWNAEENPLYKSAATTVQNPLFAQEAQ